MISTERLKLIPANYDLASSELYDHQLFSNLLNAEIPDNWPPETLLDALPVFLDRIQKYATSTGWFGWYALLESELPHKNILIGSAGFFGPPDDDGIVEIGYSVLPQYQEKGYATEMVNGLIEWARLNCVSKIIAHTEGENPKSQRVLEKLSFNLVRQEKDTGNFRYELPFNEKYS